MAVFAVQAQTEPIYTLVPQAGSNNAYAGNCDIEIDGITWNLTGNSTMIPWRMGGKSLENVDRTLYSKTPMNGEVNKVVLSVGTSSLTVNSSKLLVADNADFTNAVETSFETTASTDIEIPVSAASGSYYKFVFNVTVSGSSNKYIQISKVEFYGAAGEEGGTTEPDNGEGEGGNEEGGTTEPDNGEGEGGNEDNNDEETDQPVVEAGTHTATFNALAAGYANGEEITNVTIDSNITATFEKGSGSNAPKYYTTGTAIRCYANNSFEIKAASGNITNIVLTFGSGDKTNPISTNVGTYADGTWNGDAESVTFTIGGTKDHRRIAEIAVTYTISDNGEGEGGNEEGGTTEPDNGEGEGGNEEGGTTEPDNGEGEGGNEEGGTTEPDNGEGEGGNDNENDEETVEYTAIEFIEADKEATIKGTVVATNARSFLVEDETGIILVYLGTAPNVNVGEEVTVSGTVTQYGGMPQFPNSSIITKTGVTNEVVYPEATVMDGAAMDAFLSSPEINYVEYTGKLTIDGNYYNVAIEGAATAVGSIQYPANGFVTATSGAVVKVTGYTIGVSSKKFVNTMAITVETVEDAPEAEEPETPVETKEYTVAEALTAYVDGKQIPAIVTGYIVGAMNSTGYVAEFGTTTVNTNILLSDNADETDEANCIIVQLPKGEIREKLNLVDNPDNYKKKLRITGSIEKYFQVAGLKNPTDYELLTETTGIKNMDVVTENGVIFDITGRKVENMTVPGIYIVNGKKVLVK